MRGSLGEKIGEGAFADIHAWAPGQVVKLFKAHFSERFSRWEASVTRAAFAAGLPVPEVHGEVTLDGRFGVVLSRCEGSTLLHLVRTGAMSFDETGATLARLAHSIHMTPPPRDIPSLRHSVDASLKLSDGSIAPVVASGILALLDRIRLGDELCHGDLHPANVIMTADGPKVIDWTGAVRAPAAFDLACSHFALTDLAPRAADNPQRPIAVNSAMQVEYARLADISISVLAAEIDHYLPIVHARAALGGAVNAHRDRLIKQIEAALCLHR